MSMLHTQALVKLEGVEVYLYIDVTNLFQWRIFLCFTQWWVHISTVSQHEYYMNRSFT